MKIHTYLTKILDQKQNSIDHMLGSKVALDNLENQLVKAQQIYPVRGFVKSLKRNLNLKRRAVIAECKSASPSKGVIRSDYIPGDIALGYQKAGAAAISVLTEETGFNGSLQHLIEVKASCDLPVLRKDFMLQPVQIKESRAFGADAILVIIAALTDNAAYELITSAFCNNMDVLIEIHDEDELIRASEIVKNIQPNKYLNSSDPRSEIKISDRIALGVNNRNLHTFEVDLNTTAIIAKLFNNYFSEDTVIVSESGINTAKDLNDLQNFGVNCYLIGEKFMRDENPGSALSKLLLS